MGSVGSGSGPGLGGGSPGKGEGKGDGGLVGGMGCCEATALHSPEVAGAAPSRRTADAAFDGSADAQHTTRSVTPQPVRRCERHWRRN